MEPTRTTNDIATTTSPITTATCTTAVPDEYGSVPPGSCNSNYAYDPSFEANVAFATLFGCSLIAHIIQAFAWKKRFCWVVIMGVSWEVLAFIMKSIGARDQQQLAFVVLGQLLFLLAPLWTNAFVFMTVARLVYYVLPDQRLCRVKATTLTKLLIWIDVLCFLIQSVGGSMMSDGDTRNKIVGIGQKLYMGGCGVQLGFILIFCGMMARFKIKMNRDSRQIPNIGQVRLLIWVMYVVLAFIVIRITFRLVEFGQGPSKDNPLLANEYYTIGLDALPMLLGFLVLNAVHPGWVLRGPDSEFPRMSRKEKKQLKREKKEAKRAAKDEKKESRERRKVPAEPHPVTPSTDTLELLERDDGDNVTDHRN